MFLKLGGTIDPFIYMLSVALLDHCGGSWQYSKSTAWSCDS